MKKLKFALVLVIMLFAFAYPAFSLGPNPEQVRKIAKEAYIYGLPLVMNYKTMYIYAVLKGNPEYKAPFNEIANVARVFTSKDKSFVGPNTDTPYSFAWLDLRNEPVVLSVPEMGKGRYYSAQLIDLYTFNFAYIGTRTTGTSAGHFMIASPRWRGNKPAKITRVIPCETEFAMAFYRTQLFNPDDLVNVKKVQAKYSVKPLSSFLGQVAPKAAQKINFPPFDDERAQGIGFFDYLNFILQFCPIHPSERELRTNFSQIGIIPGKPFDAAALSPEMKDALLQGIKDAKAAIQDAWNKTLTSADLFGTREFLKNNYLNRALGTFAGIYGNSKEEAFYVGYDTDNKGRLIDTSRYNYTIRLPAGQLPPAGAFWSLTMYDRESRLLIENPINRYSINSTMLPSLKFDKDGSLTLYIQRDSPDIDKEHNWLPAPNGLVYVSLRLYLPKEEVLNGSWSPPDITRLE
jgi:hypothetical protein